MAMIPPVTGNGMSMAFESAAAATDPLAEYSEGRLSWEACGREVANRHRRLFQRRLWRANWLHRGLFSRFGEPMLALATGSSRIWRWCFSATR